MPLGDASPPADDPLIGRVLSDRYRIIRKIGEGGMGCVYQAEHALIEKKVALKVLFADLTHRPDIVARFLQEAKSASRINHENVIDISDFGQSPEGLVYIAMEYLEGFDLGRTLKAEKVVDWQRARPILMQIAKGLRAAHQQGIIHRDMKPENIFLVQREGRPDFVKVLDFGIAKVVTPDEDSPRLTQTGVIFGTPEYMSPEQAQGHAVDPRVDVYAVGCIMYHMLTGSVPFMADSFMGILTKHLLEPVVPPRKRRPDLDIPADVEAVCLRAMEKDRDKRWADMDAFYGALGSAGGLPFETSGAASAPPASLRYPELADSNAAARESKTAIAASGPRGTFDDERPVRLDAVTGTGRGVKIAVAAGAVVAIVIAAALALRSGRSAPPAAAATPTAAALAPPATAPAAPTTAAVAPPSSAPAGARPEAAPAREAATVETDAKVPARARRRKEATAEPKPDPAHRPIDVPAEDTTPAELKNPFHTP
jgi:serine/threonine-protein kinase